MRDSWEHDVVRWAMGADMTPARHVVWVLAAALSGCLVSEQPLIRDADSVTPMADGTYSIVVDGAEGEAAVSHSGGVTHITTFGDGAPETLEWRIARLERGYYVVMSREE